MSKQASYTERFPALIEKTLFSRLPEADQAFLAREADKFRFSHQELRQIAEIAVDLKLWQCGSIVSAWPGDEFLTAQGKQRKQQLLKHLLDHWEHQKSAPNRYSNGSTQRISAAAIPIKKTKGKLGLGYCPVASPKTRCCNLMTLDAVDNCGYGCTYCSIQSFYDGKEISFDDDFANKLAQLEIDPDRLYHIGTGQSSDSLMWGNSHGVLEALLDFARTHPNVILEFKTKSANVKYLLQSDLPANVICTWSMNTPTMIENEEHGTASLEKRMAAARAIADKGGVVGFHFHPMIHYDRWREDYAQVIETLVEQFSPEEVALVSLGTLTFIKPVIREIRERGVDTKILKMPLVDAEGKYSYPDDIKLDLFSHAYHCFPDSWKKSVFFYLCMENQRFWKPVFGFEWPSNEAFETAMKTSYLEKIRQRSMS